MTHNTRNIEDEDFGDASGSASLARLKGVGEDTVQYRWEGSYTGSWQTLQETEQGTLIAPSSSHIQSSTTTPSLASSAAELTAMSHRVPGVRRGMIRHLWILLDGSKAMHQTDFKPSRLDVCITSLKQFIITFFDQNPLSRLGLLVMRDGVSHILTEMSGNMAIHLKTLMNLNIACEGDISLQNALTTAHTALEQSPPYIAREILCLMGSIHTCDPGNLQPLIQQLKQSHIRCSVLSLASQVYIAQQMTQETQGAYHVALDTCHLEECLLSMVYPCITTQTKLHHSLIRMGFPQRREETVTSLCACHHTLNAGGYFCPKCKAKYCDLPTQCKVCDLVLVASPHLARSYHHIFPVAPFQRVELDVSNVAQHPNDHCISCRQRLLSCAYQCLKCHTSYCDACDQFIHVQLNNCPGCEALA